MADTITDFLDSISDHDLRRHIIHALDSRIITREQLMISIDKHNLEEEIKADDQIMKEWARVLDEIPPCPAHGSRCVPHAVEWVISHRVDDAVKNA